MHSRKFYPEPADSGLFQQPSKALKTIADSCGEIHRRDPQRDKSVSDETSENEAETVSHIVCDEMLDIAVAGELRAHLLEALEAKQPVTLDGGTVERADTAALQVLAAFFQDARSQDIDVQWSSVSAALSRAAELLGIADILALKMKAA